MKVKINGEFEIKRIEGEEKCPGCGWRATTFCDGVCADCFVERYMEGI